MSGWQIFGDAVVIVYAIAVFITYLQSRKLLTAFGKPLVMLAAVFIVPVSVVIQIVRQRKPKPPTPDG